ncbi:22672_t:CDS:1, partial [Dentiscutata erythropus]
MSLIKFILFIIILVCTIFKTNSFTPEGRGGHGAVIINNQLYIMGGSRLIPDTSPFRSSIRRYNLSNEVFYLDLTSSFSTNKPPYVDLTGTSARLQYGNEK